MQSFLQDARYGLRLLARHRSFTLMAVMTLSIGIGASVAIYSVLDAVLVNPLPYDDPDRLAFVWGVEDGLKTGSSANSYPDVVDFETRNEGFAALASFSTPRLTLTGPDLEPIRVRAGRVTHDLFAVLGVAPVEGRGFRPEEDAAGGAPVVVLSQGLRDDLFGDGEDAVGGKLTVNGTPHEVIGVMPEGYDFPGRARLWVAAGPEHAGDARGQHRLLTLGRLEPGVDLAQAEANLVTIAAALEQEYPESNHLRSARLEPMREAIFGDVRPRLLMLSGAVALVLLIACANVAGLMLTRAASRGRELAVRSALGAGPMRIVRQMLTESLLLAALGGIVGVLLAQWGLDLLVANAPGRIPRLEDAGLNGRVLLVSLGVTVAAGIVFGLAPAIDACRRGLQGALKEAARGWIGGGFRQRLRQALVIGEIALAVIVVVSAALLTRSLVRLLQVDPGFRGEEVLTAGLSLPPGSYPEWQDAVRFYDELIPRLEAIPGVQSAAAGYQHPLSGGWETSFTLPGVFEAPEGQRPEARILPVTPGYFGTVGMELLDGRVFDDRDRSDSPGVVILNESFARRFFPAGDAVGHHLVRSQWWEELPFDYEIVGVVADVKMDGLDAAIPWAMYYPQKQVPFGDMQLVLRASVEPTALAASVRRAVWDLDPDLPVEEFATLAAIRSGSVGRERFQVFLLDLFGAVALLLAAVGIYGVLSSGVVQRRQEIGVRMALGATARDVLFATVRQGMRLTMAGLALGLGGAVLAARLLEGLLFQISATDPPTLGSTVVFFAAVALVACLLPAARAARVDPLEVLRTE